MNFLYTRFWVGREVWSSSLENLAKTNFSLILYLSCLVSFWRWTNNKIKNFRLLRLLKYKIIHKSGPMHKTVCIFILVLCSVWFIPLLLDLTRNTRDDDDDDQTTGVRCRYGYTCYWVCESPLSQSGISGWSEKSQYFELFQMEGNQLYNKNIVLIFIASSPTSGR